MKGCPYTSVVQLAFSYWWSIKLWALPPGHTTSLELSHCRVAAEFTENAHQQHRMRQYIQQPSHYMFCVVWSEQHKNPLLKGHYGPFTISCKHQTFIWHKCSRHFTKNSSLDRIKRLAPSNNAKPAAKNMKGYSSYLFRKVVLSIFFLHYDPQ